MLDCILSALSLVSIIARCITHHTLGNPRAVSPVGRKGATKVSKHGRKTDVTKTGNGERGAGSGERGTEVWERVVSGNLHKNPIWPMIDDREPSKQT